MLVINYLINFEPSQHCDSLGLWRDEDEVAMRPNLKTRSSKFLKCKAAAGCWWGNVKPPLEICWSRLPSILMLRPSPKTWDFLCRWRSEYGSILLCASSHPSILLWGRTHLVGIETKGAVQTSSPGSPVCRGHDYDHDDHEGRDVMLMTVIVGIDGVSILAT